MIRLSAVMVVGCLGVASVVSAQVPGQEPATLRVGGAIRAPQKTYTVQPVYPEIAIAARAEGTVILEILIGPAGIVESARVIRSVPLLDQAATDAVYQWQYTPTLLNGVPVPIIYNITVTFSLKDYDFDAARQPAGTSTSAAAAQAAATPTILEPVSAQAVAEASAIAVRVGSNVRAPMKITHVDPVRPAIAVAAEKYGTVILELLVDSSGKVLNAKVLRSVPLLDEAAVTAARQWVYQPTLLNGAPIPVFYNVTVTFQPAVR